METKLISKIDDLELNEAYWKALHFFFSFPNKAIGLNELSSAAKISKTTANRVVLRLIKEGFLKKEVIGNVWRIHADPGHHYNFSRKICYNLGMIYEADIVGLVHEFIDNPKSIVLFGSYRKGDDIEDSDIDIAVEVSGEEPMRITEMAVIKKFGLRKNISVNLHVFSREKVDANLFSNIANGIVLDGFLEVRP